MEKFDIEAYLEGSLSQEAQAAFEQELRQNPAFAQQVEAQRRATQLLRRQLLREGVTSALAEQTVRRKPRRRWWALAGTLLILLAGYFFFLQVKPGNLPPANQEAVPPGMELENEKPPGVPSQEGKTVEENKTPNQPPVAENKPSGLLPPGYPSPNVRGQNDSNKAWKAMLDKLWYTQLPPGTAGFSTSYAEVVKALSKRNFEDAFVQLEMLESASPESDTLRLLKGYCLLEMGEGADALRYFEQLEKQQPTWKAYLEWHRGLALLLSGETKKAVLEFKKIAKTQNHPFLRQSRKALEVLE